MSNIAVKVFGESVSEHIVSCTAFYLCVYLSTYVRMYVCMYVYMYVFMYVLYMYVLVLILKYFTLIKQIKIAIECKGVITLILLPPKFKLHFPSNVGKHRELLA